MADGVPPYARILAATARGREALRLIAGRTRIPIITKPAVARELPREHLAIFELGAAARDLYVLAASRAGRTPRRQRLAHGPRPSSEDGHGKSA